LFILLACLLSSIRPSQSIAIHLSNVLKIHHLEEEKYQKTKKFVTRKTLSLSLSLSVESKELQKMKSSINHSINHSKKEETKRSCREAREYTPSVRACVTFRDQKTPPEKRGKKGLCEI